MNYDDREKLEEFSVEFIGSGFVRHGNRFLLEYKKDGENISLSGEPGGVVDIPKSLKKLASNSEKHRSIFEIIDRISHYIENRSSSIETDELFSLWGMCNAKLEPFFIPGTYFETKALTGADEMKIANLLALCGLRTSDVGRLFLQDQLSGNSLFPLLGSNREIVPTERFFFSWYNQLIFIDGEGSFEKNDSSIYKWDVRRIYPPLPKDFKHRRDHLDGDIQLALTSHFKTVFPSVGTIVFQGFFQ